jgi:hypothetical protein
MSRILFVENRSGTKFSAEVATRLELGGHQVAFLVQNHAYTPAGFRSVVMPYPCANAPAIGLPAEVASFVAAVDRGARFFQSGTRHYGHYYGLIAEFVDEYRPDIVFGEVTLFHEHLASAICEQREIPYLMPTHARYPSGRFAFYSYASPERLYGSGECPKTDEQLQDEIDAIRTRKIVPDYTIKKTGLGAAVRSRCGRLPDLARIWVSRLRGERFNTPSLLRKLQLGASQLRCVEEWDRLAQLPSDSDTRKALLFPMQMQPETNVDSWGYPHSNQAALISAMEKHLPSDWVLWVKPNPNPKYEFSAELIDVVRNATGRVIALPRSIGMAPIFVRASAIVTVTGTVGIEALFSQKPFATFKDYFETRHESRYNLDRPADILKFVEMVDAQGIRSVGPESLVRHLRHLYMTSYPGIISEPILRPAILDSENISLVTAAYEHAIRCVAGEGSPCRRQNP